MIVYDKLFDMLKEKGWTTYKIRTQPINGTRLISNSTYEKLRTGTGGIDQSTLDRLCCVLECQPGDLMAYIPAGGNA